MQVVRHGEPGDVVKVRDVEPPELQPGFVRIAVNAASINYGDIARCRGGVASVMGKPPFTLGMDVCGVVESASEGNEAWIGRRVVAMTNMSLGGMAELALAQVNGVFDAPPELDDAEAAAFLLPYHTSYLALHRRARLQEGETLLVVGGASGVGTAAIQVGKALGARVIAAAGGPEKAAFCESLGAAVGIDYTNDDIFERVMECTDGRGAEVVCDLVGGDRTEAVWTCVAREGRYIPVGFNDDREAGLTGRPLRKVSTGNFSVVGVMLSYNDAPLQMRRFGINTLPPSLGPEVHMALCDLVARGAIRPVVGRRIRMDEVAAALEDHAHRRTTGRTVVEIAGS
ncbi:MAG TPA: NADPH:quinone oxidoreductase family protein [Acidimicrobiales bacterium]